jgi:hypothetical protein
MPVGKPRGRMEDALWRQEVNLVQVRNWKEAAVVQSGLNNNNNNNNNNRLRWPKHSSQLSVP